MTANVELFNRIASSLAGEDKEKHDRERCLKHLSYAFKYVQPSTHIEYAFCVWAGTRHESPISTVNDFCIRRSSKTKDPSPYAIVDPKFWKMPDTYDVFVFREQFFVLIAELIGCSVFNRAPHILAEIHNGNCAFINFCELLTDDYTENLSESEKLDLFEKISMDYPSAIQYYYCSSIADEALNYLKTIDSKNKTLTITIEEVEVHGCKELLGFTEDHTSFLHLSEKDFVNAEKIGTMAQIDEITKEYYSRLRSIEERRKMLQERRANKHKPKKKRQ